MESFKVCGINYVLNGRYHSNRFQSSHSFHCFYLVSSTVYWRFTTFGLQVTMWRWGFMFGAARKPTSHRTDNPSYTITPFVCIMSFCLWRRIKPQLFLVFSAYVWWAPDFSGLQFCIHFTIRCIKKCSLFLQSFVYLHASPLAKIKKTHIAEEKVSCISLWVFFMW